MKRILAIAAVALAALLCSSEINAQKFGITGGATFTSMQDIEASSKTGFNVGATAQLRLPLGFSVQPSLIYNPKSAEVGGDLVSTSMDVGYLELPVSVQWGPDLLLFRPFVDVSPFVGYGLNTSNWSEFTGEVKNAWDYKNRWEYGIGLGGGLEIWKLQVVARYNWDFAPFVKPEAFGQFGQAVKESMKFGGVTLSLALLF